MYNSIIVSVAGGTADVKHRNTVLSRFRALIPKVSDEVIVGLKRGVTASCHNLS